MSISKASKSFISAVLLVCSPFASAQFNYSVYDGDFNLLPDFSSLTPIGSGTSNTISLGVTTQTETFGLVFTHQISVAVGDTYEFSTTSDDGSKLYIDGAVVVDNDGLHGAVTETAPIFLDPGTYDLRVEFFEKGGGQVLEVLYRNSGSDFAPIPSDGALAAPPQFSYAVYDGTWDLIPDFSALTPVATGMSNTISLDVTNQTDTFGLVFTNQIVVTSAGDYEFQTTSDDGTRLYIDGNVVVDNDGLHPAVTVNGGLFLNPGVYDLRLEFFEKTGGQILDVKYRSANGTFAPIPPNGNLDVSTLTQIGQWGPVIDWPHIAISAANLPDGRVLTWSSTETNAFPANREFTHSAVFNPADNSFVTTDSNFHDMFCAGVATLEDGSIVASGGNPDDRKTSRFSPDSLNWSPLPEMFDLRWYATNVTLPDNMVFSTFGKSAGNRSEKFDPVTNAWIRTPNATMQTLLEEHNSIGGLEWFPQLAVQPNGRVFHGGPTPTLNSFDPVNGADNQTFGQPTGARARKWGNVVTYDVGKVLLVGGMDPREAERTLTTNVFLVDLNGPAPVITQGAPMNFPRALSNTVTLPNGEVLVVGGNVSGQNFFDGGSIFPAEIYNPQSNTWRVVDSISIPRNYHSTALLMKDGRVLSAGGGACGGCSVNHLDGQIFSPPYLYAEDGTVAARPALGNVPATSSAGSSFIVSASADTERFSMVRLSATTHHVNTDQRYLPVSSVNNGDGTFTLTTNANPNVVIAGNYWLFAVNANGTPSIGQTVQIQRDTQNIDSDGDGVPDSEDAFPNDPSESSDTDGDGVGDNADAFPNDPAESADSDSDGVGDNADAFPNDPSETTDTDGDGLGDNADPFPNNPDLPVQDSDGDGVNDSIDLFPNDATRSSGIWRDVYTNIAGNAVALLTNSANFPDNPAITEQLNLVEGPVNVLDNYGTRIQGMLFAPESGSYVFWISGDDNVQLNLSSNGNPANKVEIASVPGWTSSRQWDKFPEQRSVSIDLVEGQAYYLEVLHKEGGGGDNVAAGWQRPGSTTIEVIGAEYFVPPAGPIDSDGDGVDDSIDLFPNDATRSFGIWRDVFTNIPGNAVANLTGSANFPDSPALTESRSLFEGPVNALDNYGTRLQGMLFAPETGSYTFWISGDDNVQLNLSSDSNPANKTEIASVPGWTSSRQWTKFPEQRSVAINLVEGQAYYMEVLHKEGGGGDNVAAGWQRPGNSAIEVMASEYFEPTVGTNAYRYYRFTPTTLRDEVAANSVQLAELSFFSSSSRVAATLVTNPGGNNPPNETPDLADDANVNTKWLDFSIGRLIYDYGQPVSLDSYSLTTANDVIARDPVQWLVEASVNGSDWQIIDDRRTSNNAVPTQRFAETQRYTLFGSGPVDSDGDGVPDDQDAFPNDPAETVDTDGDGVGDNGDAFPNDPMETQDSDGDGYGDNSDSTPTGGSNIVALPSAPRHSTTLIVESGVGGDRLWNVNPDNDSVSVSSASGTLIQEISVGGKPWSLAKAPGSDRVFVTNKSDASISIVSTSLLSVVDTISLPYGSQPHGIVFSADGSEYFVVLEALAVVQKRSAASQVVLSDVQLSGTPRHLSMMFDDSRLLVSNFITPPVPGEATDNIDIGAGRAEIFSIDPVAMTLTNTIALTHDDRPFSESQGPGLPNYLNAPVVTYDNAYALVPSKKDNIDSGIVRENFGMTFDQTVRSNTSRINLSTELEDALRIDFDNSSLATGAAVTGGNRYLLVALETSRELGVYDLANGFEVMRLPTGRAPQGVAVSSDGRLAFVHNFMDRSISRFDLSEMIETSLPATNVLSSIAVVGNETLTDTVLLGKQLFYDAEDDRLALDNYMSCASCHNDGGQDGRVWDFTSFGEGLRNTIELNGRASTGHGILHWSANFDEMQDFEGQIRTLAAGTGLMSDADFFAGTRNEPLGDPKAGISPELDALAAYLESLNTFEDSPYRNQDGSLTDAALSGKTVFDANGCATCHSGARFTNSLDETTLVDIGTLSATSGERLGGVLNGIDVPTLRDVWKTAPYLHDGSAGTLAQAVSAHDGVSISGVEMDNLVAYLQQIGNEEPAGAVDSDGDGVIDSEDAFPNDPSESSDSDGDGVGDNADAFPNDPAETTDSDGDGVGNNADAFPNDPTETTDSDGDGVGDNADDFPNDPAETTDSDGDGVGDNADAFPNDPAETTDSDGDGVGDNADAFPNDPTESSDTDGDGVGDNADVFPTDPLEWQDSDGDGIGDNSDPTPFGDEIFSEDFEGASEWMRNPAGTDSATTGLWEPANAGATFISGLPYQLGNANNGSRFLVTGGAAGGSVGTNDIDNGVTTIRSPSFDLPGSVNSELSFAYYFAHYRNSSSADFLRVKVVGTNTTRTVFEELGASNIDSATWQQVTVSLNDFAGQTVYLLIEAADAGNPSLVEAGVDDIQVTTN